MFAQEFQDPTFFTGVVASTGSREFLRPGYYKVMVTKAEVTANKDKDINTHASLIVTMESLEGDSRGVSINGRMHLRNPNEQAVAIGKSEMLALFDAVGAKIINAPNEIYNKPFWILVKDGSPTPNGRIYSEVNSYYPITFIPPYVGMTPGYVAPAAPAQVAQQPVAATRPSSAGAATAAAYGADEDIPF